MFTANCVASDFRFTWIYVTGSRKDGALKNFFPIGLHASIFSGREIVRKNRERRFFQSDNEIEILWRI